MLSSINQNVLLFHHDRCGQPIDRSIRMPTCIAMHRYSRLLSVVSDKPWVAAIHRLLKAKLRLDPSPTPGEKPQLKYWKGVDLSAAAGVGPNTISDAMTGRRFPSSETLVAIAVALDVPPAALMMDPDEAEAYIDFRQNHSVKSQSAVTEQTIRRLLEERAERMKADWLTTQTQSVIAELAAPAPEPVPVLRHALPAKAAKPRVAKTPQKKRA